MIDKSLSFREVLAPRSVRLASSRKMDRCRPVVKELLDLNHATTPDWLVGRGGKMREMFQSGRMSAGRP